MELRQQTQEVTSQTLSAQVMEMSNDSLTSDQAALYGCLYGYVRLSDLELAPSTSQPIFTSRPIDIPRYAPKTANVHSTSHDIRGANELAQATTSSYSSTDSVDIPTLGSASLEKLWYKPGVDPKEVTPTREELELYEQERDNLGYMVTGPSCSVCDEPLTIEVLMEGMSCNVCGFI
ncbi:hypothetical protein F5B18DRAFT_608043 [Nemania serpens]|nr:hypothetical protein F5B18DRAFT_608043 [Nemania serpens]